VREHIESLKRFSHYLSKIHANLLVSNKQVPWSLMSVLLKY